MIKDALFRIRFSNCLFIAISLMYNAYNLKHSSRFVFFLMCLSECHGIYTDQIIFASAMLCSMLCYSICAMQNVFQTNHHLCNMVSVLLRSVYKWSRLTKFIETITTCSYFHIFISYLIINNSSLQHMQITFYARPIYWAPIDTIFTLVVLISNPFVGEKW